MRVLGMHCTWKQGVFFCVSFVLAFLGLQLMLGANPNLGSNLPSHRALNSQYSYDQEANTGPMVTYDKSVPLIWVGGVPRSGTTLARVMLDAHPDIRCGEETRIIPRLLGMHKMMTHSNIESKRLKEAGITDEVLFDALGAYILSIIVNHGDSAPRYCNKDPFTLRSVDMILKMFPNSKFILMLRDGRATVHSIISRKVTIKGFDMKTYRGALKNWNRAMESMHNQCLAAGQDKCLEVKYEDLVLHPRATMKTVLTFLGVPFNDAVLHHENSIGKEVSLSKREPSTGQVRRPINTGSLTTWVEHIPQDVRTDMASLAPMLAVLGYAPDEYPPNYGTPDKEVVEQSVLVKQMIKEEGNKTLDWVPEEPQQRGVRGKRGVKIINHGVMMPDNQDDFAVHML